MCENYGKFQFSTLGYIPIKILSQVIHILNILNAIRVIRLNVKRDKKHWSSYFQQYVTELNIFGIDCK